MPRLLEGPPAIAHLLRRAGFAPTPALWEAWRGLPYEEAVARCLAALDEPPPADAPGFDPYPFGTIQQRWLERMLASPTGLEQKLALFWHGHFATSDAKIQDAALMWAQHRTLRTHGPGPFRALVLAMSRDVAMIRWLDGNANRVGHPNENYARELQELFTLGIGNYTEADVREAARAFTGWGSRHHDFVFRPEFHDAGPKTVHGTTGPLGGEDVVDLLVAHPACSRFLAGKLLRFFSHPDPTPAEVEEAAAAYRAAGLDTRAFLGWLFRSAGFRNAERVRALVRAPVELVVALGRVLDLERLGPAVHGALDRMGQILFQPPSVKGWPSGRDWLSSGAVVERLALAQRLLAEAAPGRADPAALEGIVFAGEVPERWAQEAAGLAGAARALTLLGGPEFQLC